MKNALKFAGLFLAGYVGTLVVNYYFGPGKPYVYVDYDPNHTAKPLIPAN